MKITKIEMFPQEELIRRLREVTLTDGVTKPYANSEIKITDRLGEGEKLRFAQTYLLDSDLKKIGQLEYDLMMFDVKLRHLTTFCMMTRESGETFSYIPPIIEWTPEDGYYVSDGMHRFYYLCHQYYSDPYAIIIKNPSAPYYAFPSDMAWLDLPICQERPEVRKIYRDPNNYKALFRDYNSQFPGIQRDRSKK